MSHAWRAKPGFKVETNGTSLINEESMTIQVSRPENNISYAVLSIDDYRSKNFVDVFDILNGLDISFRYGSDSWTKVFSSLCIATVKPRLDPFRGEILEVGAWGKGLCLLKTHCNTSYGKESLNPTIDTPDEVVEDLVDNYINKSFGGAATGYGVTKTYVSVGATPVVTHLNCAYKSNFDIINLVQDIRQTSAASAGVHWFMDPYYNLRVKQINVTMTGWTKYWKDSQADSTLEVAEDMILYDFRKNIENYANKIVLCTQLRKPGYDYPTEDSGGAALWGKEANGTVTDDSAEKIVGSHSLKSEATSGTGFSCWYPSAQNAAWDFTKIESPNNPPRINFYGRRISGADNYQVWLETSTSNGYYINIQNDYGMASGEWIHYSIPFGNYYSRDEKVNWKWLENGSGYNWNDINQIRFAFTYTSTPKNIWVDDLHFSGKLIREAYNSTAISANNEYQRVIRDDTAHDDSMKATDDTGTAARLAYAELLRRQQTPIVGVIQVPGAVDMLPGQWVHIHACKRSDSGTCAVCGEPGTFRIAKDFRIIELKHLFAPEPTGFRTTLNLTDDLTDGHAFGAPTLASLIVEYAGPLGNAEARNLKAGGLDLEIPKLSKDYP